MKKIILILFAFFLCGSQSQCEQECNDRANEMGIPRTTRHNLCGDKKGQAEVDKLYDIHTKRILDDIKQKNNIDSSSSVTECLTTKENAKKCAALLERCVNELELAKSESIKNGDNNDAEENWQD